MCEFPIHFASRYIVDVNIEENYVHLVDSQRNSYFIDSGNKTVISQFNSWFENVFKKGVSGTLTVFQYSKHQHEGEVHLVIEQFLNLKPTLLADSIAH